MKHHTCSNVKSYEKPFPTEEEVRPGSGPPGIQPRVSVRDHRPELVDPSGPEEEKLPVSRSIVSPGLMQSPVI